jgi:acyl carrier protein
MRVEYVTGGKMEAVVQKVNAIIGDRLGVDTGSLVPEANLLDDLGADSLDVVELVLALEEEFAIEVPDDDVEGIRTISDIVEYLHAHVS